MPVFSDQLTNFAAREQTEFDGLLQALAGYVLFSRKRGGE